jgi:hypothetical protein
MEGGGGDEDSTIGAALIEIATVEGAVSSDDTGEADNIGRTISLILLLRMSEESCGR